MMPSTTFRRGATEVRWLRGGLLVRHGPDAYVVDAPPGVGAWLGEDAAAVRAVVLGGGRMASVGGLLELLDVLAPHRGATPLDLRVLLGEERGATIAETWVRAWGAPYPVTIDAERIGGRLELGSLEVELLPVRAGEPDWRHGTVRSRPQAAMRIHTPDAVIAWVAGAAPSAAVDRACAEADLAVVEIGVVPWPASEHAWRLTAQEAVRRAASARSLWVVGDDGGWPGAEA